MSHNKGSPDNKESPDEREDGEEALSLLLIEDNPGDKRLLEELLRESDQRANLRWEEALSPGLSALTGAPPDLVVLDLGLPDSSGVEAVERCAEAAPAVPIVVLTGQSGMDVALEAQEAGADQYLRKDELTPALVARTFRWAVERRRMERRAQRKDDWIEAITENISGGVFRVAEGQGIRQVNDGFLDLFGYQGPEDVRGKALSALIAGEKIAGEKTAGELEAVLGEEGQVGPTEVQFQAADGSTFVGALSAQAAEAPQEDRPQEGSPEERGLEEGRPEERGTEEGGAPRYYDGVVTDITAQSATRRRRLRILSAALEQSQDAVLITEAERLEEPGPKIVYVNEAFEEMTGYAEEEILGKTPRVLQGPETDREVLDSIRAALEAEEPWEGETTNYRKDGTPHVVRWNVAPVRGEGGHVEYWVS